MSGSPSWERDKHAILGGKVHLYRRGDSEIWHCSTYFHGKNRRKTTKETSLPLARKIAEDWYLELRGKARVGALPEQTAPALPVQTQSPRLSKNARAALPHGLTKPITFNDAADAFEAEYGVINAGDVSERWVEGHKNRLKVHLRPFFGDRWCHEITDDDGPAYRLHRSTKDLGRIGKLPAGKTIKTEITTLIHVLKTAKRKGGVVNLPDLSSPFKGSMKVEARPWFSLEEYNQLRTATGKNARETKRAEDRWYAEQLHDLVLFQANTGLRPDETKNLQFRDVTMVKDQATGELILEIEVHGKRGKGFCKSMPGAVKPFQRLQARPKWKPEGRKPRSRKGLIEWEARVQPEPELPQPTDLIFPGSYLKLFNKILEKEKLKFSRDRKPRTMYSLRHSYICFRLTEGADLYNLAKNCRTSVEMIEKHYASHIKDLLDASSINVRKPRQRKEKTDLAPKSIKRRNQELKEVPSR